MSAGARPFAARLAGVSESATLRLNALVQELKAQGRDLVNLTAGEPDFPVAPSVKDAVTRALAADQSKYTPAPGVLKLRERVAAYTNAQQPAVVGAQGPWAAKHVVVSNGGKQAIFNALQALIDPGDEVLIPAPFWLSYPEMVKLAGGVPRVLAPEPGRGFHLSPERLAAALTPRTRLLILNSPSNPAGTTYSRAQFEALGAALARAPRPDRLWVLSDEIYDRIVFSPTGFVPFADACPALADRTVTVNGLSKSAAMTGWRVGWSVAPADLTAAISTLQGQSTSGINALAQAAALAALELPAAYFADNLAVYRRRRDRALEILRKASKLDLVEPEGAFYIFADVARALGAGETVDGWCERLLQEAGVAVVPGASFGGPTSVRLSFALADDLLAEGCARLARFAGA